MKIVELHCKNDAEILSFSKFSYDFRRNTNILKVYTTEGNFDLIRQNFLFYDTDVPMSVTHLELVEAAHAMFFSLYEARHSTIIDAVSKFKTLEDYDVTLK